MREYLVSEADMVAAARAHQRLMYTRGQTWLAMVCILAALLWCAYMFESHGYVLAIGAISGLAAMFLFGRWLVARGAARQWRETPGLRAAQRFEMTDQGFRLESVQGLTDMSWRDLFAWHAHDGGLMLYVSSYLYFVLPNHMLGDERGLLNERLDRANVPRRSGFLWR